MNNQTYQQPEMEINLKEVIWDLLEQWKAILVVALIMAILLTSFKYSGDMKAYRTAVDSVLMEQTDDSATLEERIADILNDLPDDERAAVEHILNEEEWLESQKKYLNESVLMSTDPFNQKRLMMTYDIDAEEADDLSVLLNLYTNMQNDEDFVKNIGESIDKDAYIKYIYELLSVQSASVQSASVQSASVPGRSISISIRVILPESADENAVQAAVSDAVNEYAVEINSTHPHDIALVETKTGRYYNGDGIAKKRDYINNVNSLENTIKNAQTSLSDTQKSAIEKIEAIFATNKPHDETATDAARNANTTQDDAATEQADDNSEAEILKVPGLSKKYAMLGFILGVIAYAFIYLMWLIMRGRVNYASDLENYTGTRLLGEIYNETAQTENSNKKAKTAKAAKYGKSDDVEQNSQTAPNWRKWLDTLLHCPVIEKYRRKDLLDRDKQIEKMVSSVDATCKHAGIKEVTLLRLTETSDDIIKAIKKAGIKVTDKFIDGDFNEKELLDEKNAIFLADANSKSKDLISISNLCNQYDINAIGSIFVGE